ncbi:MAG: MBL fold metallo-hydrolase [Oscillospiraceae bacterium]|nr:MBL fold metallo-hydrolase [Oscillospiraceae bacterium]
MMKHNSPGGLFSSVLAILVIFACAVLYEHGIINDDIYLDILSSINGNSHSVSAELEVHFLDVGQAECILIKAPEKNVLIDAGDIGCEKKIENYLRTQGIFSIDLFIISHPHADHMGSSSDILRKFPVSELIIPEIPSEYLPTTSLFNDFLSAANKKNCRLSYAKQGQTYDLGGGAYLEILSPVGYSGDNLNNYSVISKLTYGENSFLFTGDLEKEAELLLVSSGADISCTVLNAGHHGSSTSNCAALLKAASPEYAVISCGFNNDYGHPHKEVISSFREFNIKYYRTDYDGDVVLCSDGKTITAFTKD